MALNDALKVKVAGQKAAFTVDQNGKCQAQGAEESAIIQSTQFARQIHDIVGLPGLDTLWVGAAAGIFVIRISDQGQAGLILEQNCDLAATQKFMEAALFPSASGGSGGTGDTMAKVRKIATEYLTDFADTALMIQIKQAGLDENNPQADQLDKLTAGLEKAALMIIGLDKAREMAENIRKAIK